MASVYLKAALLTIAVLLIGFFFIGQLDAMRAAELRSSVEELALQSETERLLFLYAQTGNGSPAGLCTYLSESSRQREDKAFALSQKIQYYENGNLLNGEYDAIRNQYYLANAGLYLNLLAAEEYCGASPYSTVLFFYRISPDCAECRAQGGVLDSMRGSHPSMRVFAFPIDTSNPVVKALMQQHGITSAPSVVINEGKVLPGLKSEGEIAPYLADRKG